MHNSPALFPHATHIVEACIYAEEQVIEKMSLERWAVSLSTASLEQYWSLHMWDTIFVV